VKREKESPEKYEKDGRKIRNRNRKEGKSSTNGNKNHKLFQKISLYCLSIHGGNSPVF